MNKKLFSIEKLHETEKKARESHKEMNKWDAAKAGDINSSENNEDYFTSVPNEQSKRTKKFLKKYQLSALETFYDSHSQVSWRVWKRYVKIISDFMKFSPMITPSKLTHYISWKFKLELDETGNLPTLSGTELQVFNCLQRFLKHLYKDAAVEVRKDYSLKARNNETSLKMKLNNLNLEDLYHKLIGRGCIEDAMILHLIYAT